MIKNISLKKHGFWRIAALLIAADLFFLFLHLIFGKTNQLFHLDFENNLPTFYQSGKLIIFGSVLLFKSITKKSWSLNKIKFFLVPLSLFLLMLGFDELLQIHENIYRIFEIIDYFHPSQIVDISQKIGYRSSLWIIYYIPLIIAFVLWCGYWMKYFQSKSKPIATMISISCALLLVVLICEIFSSSGKYSEVTYFWLVTVEEGAEMILGTILVKISHRVFKEKL